MSDIFDEVDDILSEVDTAAPETETTDVADKNFNETELQDIMAEIENLEKEFEAEVVVTPKAAKQTDLQSEIDRELEMSLEKMKTEAGAPVEATPKVLSFEKKSPIMHSSPLVTSSNSEISFEATGQMNLSLDFKIGEESAKLMIDPVKGLVVIMNGAELCINQETGCKVTMDSGVTFTIPLTSASSALKKKSA